VDAEDGMLRQLRLFGLEALGEAGWLKALKLEEHATRQPRLQQAPREWAENMDLVFNRRLERRTPGPSTPPGTRPTSYHPGQASS